MNKRPRGVNGGLAHRIDEKYLIDRFIVHKILVVDSFVIR